MYKEQVRSTLRAKKDLNFQWPSHFVDRKKKKKTKKPTNKSTTVLNSQSWVSFNWDLEHTHKQSTTHDSTFNIEGKYFEISLIL